MCGVRVCVGVRKPNLYTKPVDLPAGFPYPWQSLFTSAWAERTALYVSDIENLPAKTWKKILLAAKKIVEEKKGVGLKPVSAAAGRAPRRRQIVDADESD